MEILYQFGFEPKLFFAQIVNFLILAFLFKKFLYKPILRILNERESKIRKGLQDAQEAELLKQEAQERKKQILREVNKEADIILENSRKEAANIKTQILVEAKEEAQAIIQNAQKEADLQFKRMKKEAEILAVSLSQTMLRNVIESLFQKEEQDKVFSNAIKRLKHIQEE